LLPKVFSHVADLAGPVQVPVSCFVRVCPSSIGQICLPVNFYSELGWVTIHLCTATYLSPTSFSSFP